MAANSTEDLHLYTYEDLHLYTYEDLHLYTAGENRRTFLTRF